jgi:hypothetical protein
VITLPILFWDASALAKRYAYEVGTATVNALFGLVPRPQMVGTVLGYAETRSVLLRHLHRGTITASAYTTSKTSLRAEVVDDPDFVLLTVDDAVIYAGIAHIELYSVNANDGAILAAFLRYFHALPPPVPGCALVASDTRLIAAAQAEGLKTLNPELVSAANTPALLAAL